MSRTVRHWVFDPRQKQFTPIEQFPQALWYGYGVYTTFAWPIEPRWLDAHFERLARDGTVFGMHWQASDDNQAGLKGICHSEAGWRLTLMPDVDDYSSLLRADELSDTLLFLSERVLYKINEAPMHLKSTTAGHTLPGIKHTALSPMLAEKRRAIEEGFDDIVWVNPDRTLSEASIANIMFLKNDALLTPDPDTHSCLSGITRTQILELLPQVGLTHDKSAILYEHLHTMDAAFTSNALAGLRMVESIDGITFTWPPGAKDYFDKLKSLLGQRVTDR